MPLVVIHCLHILNGRFDPRLSLVCFLSVSLAQALDHLHSLSMAHLDVKPANILCSRGVYKLSDYGCARVLSPDSQQPLNEGDSRYLPK